MSTSRTKSLVIVESPTKARTISQYLDSSYTVMASVGHIRDLPKSNKKAIDIPGGFIPHYEISPKKDEIVSKIQKAAGKAAAVFLATDPDREGEAIAWHIMEACDLKDPQRVVFHEITKPAVQEAFSHSRKIDQNLRRAQEARRVLDRLVGYDLSGLIWKKVRYGLSAGRVQSPALRILSEREREIRAFRPEPFWVISGDFQANGKTITLTADEEPKTQEEADRITKKAKQGSWKVVRVKETEVKRSPRAPFITSTLQQTASSRLGFSPSRTMGIAQKLYEKGHITYMRTDSTNMSALALRDIHREIASVYGKEYLSPRTFKKKSKLAQEAHEAIRPTSISTLKAGTTEEQKKLYTLIRERTLASQMSDAKLLRTKISANIEDQSIPNFSAVGSIVLFPGWLAGDTRARGEETEMPRLEEQDPLELLEIREEEKETQPPPRYTEAGLVKELEKRGIGRPSTYATIMKTLADRGYVEKEGRSLRPTDTGEVVSEFLEKHFTEYVSDDFTAEMENELDEIAEGKREYEKMLSDFYQPFQKAVQSKEDIEKLTNLGDADPQYTCPACKGPMVIKLSRSGKFLSCKKFPDCTGARKIDGSEIEEPKETGEDCPRCGGKLIERDGRYGKFVACSNYPKCKYVKQSEEEEEKRKTGVTCPECKKGDIMERRGRFGPFYSCSNYPDCKFIMKSRPTGDTCKECGALMMEGTKTIPDRCSDKSCPNHNPHKLKKKK